MILIASANGIVGMDEGRAILEAGGSALDAVEAVARAAEDNPDDHTVGYGGYPNILGRPELDAAVMEGTHRRVGAVAAVTSIKNPVTAARRVLDTLPHVLLVGEGAELFAAEQGLPRQDMLSDAAAEVHFKGLRRLTSLHPLDAAVRDLVTDPDHVTGTVNVLGLDRNGRLAAATSTSGWAWKHPGRVGDTPIPGAGLYADDRYGAAACTGWGELTVRAATAHTIVTALRHGADPAAAAHEALDDLPAATNIDHPGAETPVSVLVLTPDGRHAAASTSANRRYAYWDDSLPAPELRDRETASRTTTEPA